MVMRSEVMKMFCVHHISYVIIFQNKPCGRGGSYTILPSPMTLAVGLASRSYKFCNNCKCMTNSDW